MTTDISRVQGNYRIQSSNGTDVFVVDTTGTGYNILSTPTQSKVVITGDLYVLGTKTEFSSTNVTVKDPTILLNDGNTFGVGGSGYVGGLKISRSSNNADSTAAFLQWNNAATWHGTGQISNVQGVFEFRVGTNEGGASYSALKANKILIDENSASTIGGQPRLNIFGSDNPFAVLSVSGTQNYENNILDDDDIPNVRYVLDRISNITNRTLSVTTGSTYLTVIDQGVDFADSAILGVVDGNPSDKVLPLSTGTVVLYVSKNQATIQGLSIIGNAIQPTGSNRDFIIRATGNGSIKLESGVVFQTTTSTPTVISGQTAIYSGNPGSGGTGLYYVSSGTNSAVTSGELVSRKKALMYSLIF